jgi:hypothetical protein
VVAHSVPHSPVSVNTVNFKQPESHTLMPNSFSHSASRLHKRGSADI